MDWAVSSRGQRDVGGHVGRKRVLHPSGQVSRTTSRSARCSAPHAPSPFTPQTWPPETRGDGTQNTRATAPEEPKCWRLPGASWPRQRTTEASQLSAQTPRMEFRAAVDFDVSGRCPNTSPNLPFRRSVYPNTLTGVSRGPKKAHGKCSRAPRRLIRRRSIFFHGASE